MAQHDMNIANQGFPATRADLNNALQALVSNSSGTSAPSTTFANQWWYDTTNNKMYIRNEANNAWIVVFTLDQTNNEWQLTTGVIQAKDSDGLALKTDDGTTRLFIKDSDGNIGLGNSSPSAPLHISSASTDAQILLENTNASATGSPSIDLYRNSASPADNDLGGSIKFHAENDAGEKIQYQIIQAYMPDVSDGSEDGAFQQYVIKDGTSIQRLEHNPTETVFNQDSADVNFRVESDGNANMLFVDAGNNIVGVGREPASSTGSVLQLEGADGMALRRPSQTNSFTIRPQASTDGIRFTQEGTGDVGHFDQYGRFGVGVSPSYALHVKKASSADFVSEINNSGTDPYGMVVRFSGAAPDNNVRHFQYYTDISAVRYVVDADGDVRNHDNSYGAISDERVKEQISDATSQWDDIKALTIRKFKFKTDVATGDSDIHWRLGVIAQEVENAGMNGLVSTEADTAADSDGIISQTGTTTKSVKYSVLYMKAVKALQEAMARIETLEAKVTALESK